MYTNNALAASAAALNIFGNTSSANGADGSFADIFGSRIQGGSGSGSGFEALMNRLSSRFPNANVSTTKNEKTQGAETNGSEKTDSVNVDPSLLPAMANSEDILKKVEDAISAFLDSDAGKNAMSGAYAYRSVTITITTVTYQSQQRYSDSQELAFSQELESSYQDVLKEKLQELINRIFGLTGEEDGKSGETSESAAVDSTTETEKTAPSKTSQNNLWSGFSNYASFSMSLYYSNSMIQSLGGNGQNADASTQSMQSFMFSASYQSTMNNFQDFANFSLPQSIFDQLGQGNTLSGPFTSLFEGSLGKMGLTSGGFSQTTDGFMFNMRNGRDFLSEYLEMAGWGTQSSVNGTEAEEKVEAADEAVAGTQS